MKKLWKRAVGILCCLVLTMSSVSTAFAVTRLDEPEGTYWDADYPYIALWEEVEDAYRYQIYLYRSESKIENVLTKNTLYNFEKYLVKEGYYSFKVKALTNTEDFYDSYWSEVSDIRYVTEEEALAYQEVSENGSNEDNGISIAGPGETEKIQWILDEFGWKYYYEDGSYPANGWFQDPSTSYWYYFNEQGYMMTGWLQVDGINYYCNESGAMVNGTVVIDGVTQYFEQSGAWIPQ